MKYQLRAVLISIIITLCFTFSVYNSDILSVKHFLSYLFYSLLTVLLGQQIKNKILLGAIVLFPVLAIDLTTLFNGQMLIPLRFPFATIYPILGIITGILILLGKRVLTALVILFSIAFSILSHMYFIPRIIWGMQNKNKPKVSVSILNDNFKTIADGLIKINDTIKSKVQLVEFYFVRCLPCESKYEILKKIREKYSKDELDIIMICDGEISPYDEFKRHQENKKIPGITFLYDNEKKIERNIKGERGYPTELLISYNVIKYSQAGFNDESASFYYKSEVEKIDNLLKNEK
jgi:hypothetical protein